MKRNGKTPWQLALEMARLFSDNDALRERIYKYDSTKKNSVTEWFPTPLIDASVDEIVYAPKFKVPEPKKEREPEMIYPAPSKRFGGTGKVVLYVKINAIGYPVRIAVKESTDKYFTRYAIAHAMQTTWEANHDDWNGMQSAWFESVVTFDAKK